MPRKPPKQAPKRVTRPKAPKTRLVTDATPQRLPAPKTRVELEFARCACRMHEAGFISDNPDGTQNVHGLWSCVWYHRPAKLAPPSRWSRLWAWLGRLGRP